MPEARLPQVTLDAAWNPANRRGVVVPMGLGWFVQNHRGERVVWHFGLVNMFITYGLLRWTFYDPLRRATEAAGDPVHDGVLRRIVPRSKLAAPS